MDEGVAFFLHNTIYFFNFTKQEDDVERRFKLQSGILYFW